MDGAISTVQDKSKKNKTRKSWISREKIMVEYWSSLEQAAIVSDL